MKKNYLVFALFILLLSSCDKNYKAVKKISGNWKLTSILRDGVSEDMNILKIKLLSTYEVGDSWFGYYDEENVDANGQPTANNIDLHIEFSNKGKNVAFNYRYGSINGWTENFEVIKIKKNRWEIKAVGQENYYVFEN